LDSVADFLINAYIVQNPDKTPKEFQMEIELNLYATLARYLPETLQRGEPVMDVDTGITNGELLEGLSIPMDKVKLIFLDGVHSSTDAVLEEGSRVGVFPPVGGG
jgi:molybdopterin converting factor small subunit